MFIVSYYDEGLIELFVSREHLRSILHLLENSKRYYKVTDRLGVLSKKSADSVHYQYWLESNETFR